MYSICAMQAVVTAAVFHVAVAQVPFQLVCPEQGFTVNEVNTVECTVRGSDVTGAGCAFPVSSIRLETLDSGVEKPIAHSPFPTCDNDWSSVNNDNGRCIKRDTNTDVYTYQFNVTADRAVLTNLTGLRCFAVCSAGPIVGNPFTYNSSWTCGPPVIFAEQSTAVPPSTSGSVPPTTSPPVTVPLPSKELTWWEILLIVAGIMGLISAAGGASYRVWKNKNTIVLYSTVTIPTKDVKFYKEKGVIVRDPTKKEKKEHKDVKLVFEINLASKDQKEIKNQMPDTVKQRGGKKNACQCCC